MVKGTGTVLSGTGSTTTVVVLSVVGMYELLLGMHTPETATVEGGH